MFTFKFIKQVDNEYVTYVYTARSYEHYESGKFVLHHFCDSDDEAVIWVNGNNYERCYVMNKNGQTVDDHMADNAKF